MTRDADARRARVEALKLETPGYRLRERLGTVRPAGRLERALRRVAATDPLRLLCRLPSLPVASAVAGSDAGALARLFEAGGAAAFCVPVEPDRTRGDLARFLEVRAASRLPILLDNPVFDEYQLLDAAVRGADGVRIAAAGTSDVELQVLASRARLLGLDPLVEVHDRNELRRALTAGATLLALGWSQPGSTAADPPAALGLLPLVPSLVTAVAWSGIPSAGDLRGLRATRCDALLAGEGLLAGADPAAALATLAAAARG